MDPIATIKTTFRQQKHRALSRGFEFVLIDGKVVPLEKAFAVENLDIEVQQPVYGWRINDIAIGGQLFRGLTREEAEASKASFTAEKRG